MPAGATGTADSPVTATGPRTRARESTAAEPPNSTSTPTAPAPTPAGTTGSPVTTPAAGTPPSPAPEPPVVVLQRRQKTTPVKGPEPNVTATPSKPARVRPKTGATGATGVTGTPGIASGPNDVAEPPQLVAGQAGALAAELASSAASAQALAFYRIPLFLLPIYQAAAVQYGVPWQILAAINEIETDYGSDQSVSTAGAVGWMQFEPSTWTRYGVDALNAGYADPYNPVDAIFAAARYLRAAGAAQNLKGAILAYNHSEEYADSVLLRAKLISTYPQSVIGTLTDLVDARPPVSGPAISWQELPGSTGATSSTG